MAKDGITVQRLDRLIYKIKNIPDNLLAKEVTGAIGNLVKFNILKRTAKGVDSEKTPFEPYSESWAGVRISKGLSINKVDLFFSGTMLSALTYDAQPDHVRIFFMDTRDKRGVSSASKAVYNDELRPFFNINADDIKEIMELLGSLTRKSLRG